MTPRIRVAFWADSVLMPKTTGTATFLKGLFAGLIARHEHNFAITLWTTSAYQSALLRTLLPAGNWRDATLPISRQRILTKSTWLAGFPDVSKWIGHHDLYLSGYHWPLGRRDVPFIGIMLDFVALDCPEEYNRSYRAYVASLLYRASFRIGCARATRIVCISDFTYASLCRHLPEFVHKCVVIPHGINPADWESREPRWVLDDFNSEAQLPTSLPFFLTVGQHVARKNLHGLIRAFSRVRCDRSTDAALLIVGGENVLTSQLKALACQYNVADRVFFVGHVNFSTLRVLMQHAHAFVMPSLYEGFGLPVLEAFAAGTPVICSSTTALGEIAGNAALVVNPRDDADLADAMCQVLADRNLREQLLLKGRRRVYDFTMERAVDAYADLMLSTARQGAYS